MRHEWRHQGARQRTEGLAVDADAFFLVHADQAVAILPVADRALQRHLLGIGHVVGNAAALIGGEARSHGDLGHQPRIGCAVAHLHGLAPGPRPARGIRAGRGSRPGSRSEAKCRLLPSAQCRWQPPHSGSAGCRRRSWWEAHRRSLPGRSAGRCARAAVPRRHGAGTRCGRSGRPWRSAEEKRLLSGSER